MDEGSELCEIEGWCHIVENETYNLAIIFTLLLVPVLAVWVTELSLLGRRVNIPSSLFGDTYIWSEIALLRGYNCANFVGQRQGHTYHLRIWMVMPRNTSLVVIGDWDTGYPWNGEGLIDLFITTNDRRCSEESAGDEGSDSGSTGNDGLA